jgi:anti-sigma factor RsiW
VSLLFHRHDIARAVAGDLPPAREKKLREHLHGCARCRAYYDRLSALADALNPARGAARAQARLAEALDDAAPPALGATATATASALGSPSRRRLWAASFILAPAAIIVLWAVRGHHPPAPNGTPEEVTLRGETDAVPASGASSAPAVAGPSILVYASRRTGPTTHAPVRLVSSLPGSGEGRVSLADYIQFSVGGLRSPAYLTIVGVDAEGGVHRYVPRAGGGVQQVQPAEGPTVVGPSFDLGQGHHPGRLRLIAAFSAQPLGSDALAALTRVDGSRPDGAAPGAAPGQVITGLLIVEP